MATRIQRFVGAAACFAAAGIELRLILAQAPSGDWAFWLVHDAAYYGCIVAALLILRSALRQSGAGVVASRLLFGLFVVHVGFAILGVFSPLGAPNELIRSVSIGILVLCGAGAALFATLAFFVAQSEIQGKRYLVAFAVMEAVAFLLRITPSMMAVSTGMTLFAASYFVLALFFVRATKLSAEAPPLAETASGVTRRGAVYFSLFIIGLSGFLSIVASAAMSMDPDLNRNPLVTVSVLLLAPQLRILETYGYEDQPAMILLLSLVVLPIVFLPAGIRVVFARTGPVWRTVVVQAVFLLVHLFISFAALISGIQM